MSDTILSLVPSDPNWQPTKVVAQATASYLRNIWPQAEAIDAVFYDEIRFIDPGQNWSGVECNSCGQDAEEWFSDAMDSASESDFSNLETTAPCCGSQTNLNSLHYIWPAAFGRFELQVRNPDMASISADQANTIARTLGISVTAVWARI